jgi:hypothetical protein
LRDAKILYLQQLFIVLTRAAPRPRDQTGCLALPADIRNPVREIRRENLSNGSSARYAGNASIMFFSSGATSVGLASDHGLCSHILQNAR